MSKNTLLVVDDSLSELRLLKEAFKDTQFEYKWRQFTAAPLAFDFIKAHASDIFIILCDINMPAMTGLELLDTINKNYKLKLESIPFIFLSSSVSEVDIERAYALSAQGYFQKPIEMDQMTKLLGGIIYYWSEAQIPNVIKHPLN
jgi:CheY-like chemotaxis protein